MYQIKLFFSSLYRPASEEYGTWEKGVPLPSSLGYSRLERQCTVRINSTHVFMAGGYARSYDITNFEGNNEIDGEFGLLTFFSHFHQKFF